MAIRKVGVLGCGLMGAGIAEVAAKAGCDVVVREVSRELLDKGMGRLRGSLDRAVEKGKLEAVARDAALARLTGTTEIADLGDCDLVVEAIVENLDEKKRTFAALDAVAKPGAIFASNTSSLTVTQLAVATKRPDRFLGLHFFNPVPVMKLVEVVRTLLSDEAVLADLTAWCREVGKTPIACKDNSGFIVNRLLVPYLLDAVLPDGALHPARLRRSRHHLLHRQHHVRGVPREALRAAAAAQADGASRPPRQEERPRLLRLLGEVARTHRGAGWPSALSGAGATLEETIEGMR